MLVKTRNNGRKVVVGNTQKGGKVVGENSQQRQKTIKSSAAKAYAKYQKFSEKAAGNLLVSGM